jgi:mRNA interferase MazF
MRIRRGEIYLANLGNAKHTDIGKIRPVVVFQNDLLNRMIEDGLYDDVVVIPLSSQIKKSDLTWVLSPRDKLEKRSTVLCYALKMISSKRLLVEQGPLTLLQEDELQAIEQKVQLTLGIA